MNISKIFYDRRKFIQMVTFASVGIASLSSCKRSGVAAEIVVVGGGVGGISFIRALHAANINVHITLVEPAETYHNCPLSSHVLAGLLPDDKIRQTYAHISKIPGVTWVREKALHINHERNLLITSSGTRLPFDKLVISPGIGMQTDAIENYNATNTPHGWKNDKNLFTLKAQLQSMRDGGTVLITAPLKPYRCMPAPYERAGLVASYLKRNKPASKVLILDQKPSFPQQELFLNAWQEQYGSMVEWVTGDFVGEITGYSAADKSIETEFDSFSGDVINLIPNQNAGKFALDNGLTDDSGWCPVDLRTMASTLADDIYIIGDAINNNELPKAASISESQALVAAAAIGAELKDKFPPTATFNSLCWSATNEGHGVKVIGQYHVEKDGTLIRDSLQLSSEQDSDTERQNNYRKAQSWNDDLFIRLYGAQ